MDQTFLSPELLKNKILIKVCLYYLNFAYSAK